MIKVNDVILDGMSGQHHVADVLCIERNFQLEGILDRTHRADSMHRCAYTADALQYGPRIARVAVQHNLLDAAPHLARGPGPCNLAILDFDINAKVAFDTSDWINGDSCRHGGAPIRLPAPAR